MRFSQTIKIVQFVFSDSLDACKVHYELGAAVGQQRKLKELVNWLKKKKRRTIRKDELISFLIGKQVTHSNSNNNLSSIFSASSNTLSAASSSNNINSAGGLGSNMFTGSNPGLFNNQSQLTNGTTGSGSTLGISSSGTSHHQNVFFGNPANKQQLFRPSPPFASSMPPLQGQQQQSQHQHQSRSANPNSSLANANSATCPSGLASLNQGGIVSSNSDTSSDLATFREALIMHSELNFFLS
jgi:hypothetical protein